MTYRSRSIKKAETETSVISKPAIVDYNTIEYPVGSLGSEQYPHYTIFYINETDKSIQKSKDSYFSTEQVNLETKTANLSMSVAARKLARGEVVTENLKEHMTTEYYNGVNKTAAALKGTLSEFTSARKRIKTAICLPAPLKIRANYNASYSQTEEIGALGAVIAAAVSNNGDAIETALLGLAPAVADAAVETGKSLISRLPGMNAGTLDKIVGRSPGTLVSQMASKLSGRVMNKRQEQLFTNMDFRVHNISYLFIPRNEEESLAIEKIIKTFKIYMHPDLNAGTGSSLLIVPAEFDIEFRYGDDENDSLSKIATCALRSLDVNYTAIGEFVAFRGTTHPVAISLDMSFVEMEPIHRSMITKGF